MRTTLALSSDILRDLRALAQERGLSLTKTANWILRTGLAHLRDRPGSNRSYSEPVVDLGTPRVDLQHALQVAAVLEDRQVIRELEERR